MKKPFLLAAVVCAAPWAGRGAELTNDAMIVRLDPASGAIAALVDRASGRNFVAPGDRLPLYRLTLAGPPRTEHAAPRPHEMKKSVTPDGEAVDMRFRHDVPALDVRVRVTMPSGRAPSRWRLDIPNVGSAAVVRVDFPCFAVPPSLGTNADETCAIVPHPNNDQRFWNLPEEFRYLSRARGGPAAEPRWPMKLAGTYAPDAVQMTALYDPAAGLYFATEDPGGEAKEITLTGLDAGRMTLNFGHLRPREPGRPFAMGYDAVLGVFRGDWTAAAELYRDWALRQRWCASGALTEKDTPEWIKRNPAHLRFVFAHPTGTRGIDWRALPAKLDRFRTDFPDLYPDAMVNLVNFDTGGFWQGFYGDRWPAFMGDEAFSNLVRGIKDRGLHPSIEPFAWHVSLTHDDRPGYDLSRMPAFDALVRDTFVRPEGGGTARKGTCTVCLRSDYGRRVFADDARRCAPWGMDLLQLMEIGLVSRMDCHNPAHGHPPGRGAWIYEGAYEAARLTREAGRAANPDFGTDKEETSEFLIPVLDCMYIRNAQVKNMRWNGRPQFHRNNVPLFDFVYHDRVVLIDGFQAGAGGESPATLRWCAGIAAVLGHCSGPLFNGDPDSALYQAAKDGGAFEILVHARRACLTYARDIVVFGRVLPPPGIDFPEFRQPAQAVPKFQQCAFPGGRETVRTDFVTPAVLQSAHRAAGGTVGLSFVNVSDAPQDFALDPAIARRYLGRDAARITVRHNARVVAGRAADGGGAPLGLTIAPRALLFVTLE